MTLTTTVPTRYWSSCEDGRLRCELCPRYCRLKDGARGLCFVRKRENDSIVLTTYGRSSGFCIDPIEKKPLNHFLPGTSVLSLGTAGCNLACNFCQNHDISKSREMDTLQAEAAPETIARAARELGCASVAFTYNDPVIFHEYARDTAIACHVRGIRTVAVTAGYITERARADFFEHMDAANIDLKAFTERFYREVTKSELGVVLDTLRFVRHETGTWLEITTLLIPGENDSDAEIDAMTRFIADELGVDVPLHFSAFHPDYRMRDRRATPHATLVRARRIAIGNGLHHVYLGNVHDHRRQSTWCPACGELLIGRDGYVISDYRLDDQGACRKCGTALAGVFAGRPGNWGARRLPVDLRPFALAR